LSSNLRVGGSNPSGRAKSGGGRIIVHKAVFTQPRLRAHTAIGGIAPSNPASVALPEDFGVKNIAHCAEARFKFDRWIDGGYWQAKGNA